MCGLIGTIGFKDDKKLNIKILNHRGPDAMGKWESLKDEFPVVLGHTRLAILDLTKAGNQPFLSEDNRYVFVYNGEIYNFIELRSELELKGQVFYTKTDTEVFFKGLILEGPSFQLRCNGMWSFCLWDRKKNLALFGRDRFGKKPFFYHLLNNKLVFASEMKGIYPFLNSIEPNDNINIYLQKLFDYESSEYCVIKGIRRLPPGHYAIYENGKFNSYRWWNTLDNLVEVSNNYEDQVEKWREIFLDAVKIRMRADVPCGTALSGGIDSSAVFCALNYLAKKEDKNILQSKALHNGFLAHYPGSFLDETKWAKLVSDATNKNLKSILINPEISNWSINETMYQVEDPYSTLPIPMLELYRAMSKEGTKVTIDGHGADELFSGYSGHLNKAISISNLKQTSELISIINSLQSGEYKVNNKNMIMSYIIQKLIILLKPNLINFKCLLKKIFTKKDQEFLRYKLEYPDQSHHQFKKFDLFSKVLYEIFHVTTLPTLLRNYDRYSMASGVEIRMPFMDHRLVTYTFSLPWTSKVGGTYTKRIMRDALKGILPEAIRTRRDKIGWNAPLNQWFKGPLKNEIEQLIKKELLSEKAIKAFKEFQKKTNPDFSEGQKIWEILMPELWKRSLFIRN
jgi:asparagine synthase (glutamine-hydrolysing)